MFKEVPTKETNMIAFFMLLTFLLGLLFGRIAAYKGLEIEIDRLGMFFINDNVYKCIKTEYVKSDIELFKKLTSVPIEAIQNLDPSNVTIEAIQEILSCSVKEATQTRDTMVENGNLSFIDGKYAFEWYEENKQTDD